MSSILKSCPSCGKRFEVRLTNDVVLSTEKELVMVEVPQQSMSLEMPRSSFSTGPVPGPEADLPPLVQPVVAEKDVVEDTFTCGHCGHTWKEKRSVFRKEGGGEIKEKIVSEGAP